MRPEKLNKIRVSDKIPFIQSKKNLFTHVIFGNIMHEAVKTM